MGGNEEVRQALENDEIDLYWEYTATGWLVHLSETRSIPDPQEQYEAVREQDLQENDIEWLPPAPGNDTYAIAASGQTQQDLGVENISDLARLVEERPGEATLCFNNDDGFRSRFDGLPGMERAYGFQFPEENLIEVSADAVYGAVDEAEICNFGVAFTTSGFIQDLDLPAPRGRRGLFRRLQPVSQHKEDHLRRVPAAVRRSSPRSPGNSTPRPGAGRITPSTSRASRPRQSRRGGSARTGLSSSFWAVGT